MYLKPTQDTGVPKKHCHIENRGKAKHLYADSVEGLQMTVADGDNLLLQTVTAEREKTPCDLLHKEFRIVLLSNHVLRRPMHTRLYFNPNTSRFTGPYRELHLREQAYVQHEVVEVLVQRFFFFTFILSILYTVATRSVPATPRRVKTGE